MTESLFRALLKLYCNRCWRAFQFRRHAEQICAEDGIRYVQGVCWARVGREQRLTLSPVTWVIEPDGTTWPT